MFFPSNIKSDEEKNNPPHPPADTHYLSYSFVTKEQWQFYFGEKLG